MEYTEVIKFWFETLTPAQWWKKDLEMDQEIKKRFENTHEQAITGKLAHWRSEPLGRLAEVIVIDQFSRNIYRNDPRSFKYDEIALRFAREAVAQGADLELDTTKRSFLYLPFMHSESKEVHEEAVKLYSQEGLEGNLNFEYSHKKIIDRFGRYPHRNEILGRQSTAEEIEFLKEKNSSF